MATTPQAAARGSASARAWEPSMQAIADSLQTKGNGMSRVLNVGVIGCGSMARGTHIPLLMKSAKYRIHALADQRLEAATAAAQETGASYATADVDRVLDDDKVDAVFITTRHDSHADLSIRAAQAGKHILCEKPMGLNRDQCRRVAEAVRRSGVKYTVGYNRGMAPLVVRARELLASVPGSHKKLIYHRIQAPFAETHWTHDPQIGGGRFVGEGCHIFDLLCELVQARPVSVYAAGGTFLNPDVVRIPDSGIVTLAFEDGSVGTTLIASAGCKAFPKEATEIYCDHRTICINDFREMEWCGFGEQPRETARLDASDKGQAVEVDRFADAILNDSDPPNGIVQAARAAVISFMVNESIAACAPVPIREQDYCF